MMTAKLRKKLVQRKRRRNGFSREDCFKSETGSTAEAVEQVEQTTGMAVQEVDYRAKQTVIKAVMKASKEHKRMKKRQEVPGDKTPAPPAMSAPTPEERMRQRAVDAKREMVRHPDIVPESNGPFSSAYYGKSASVPGISIHSREKSISENQSIHQSIRERPRRSSTPRTKPKGGAVAPKTRQAVERIASTNAAPASPGRQITSRARRKAQGEAKRGIAHGAKQAAKAAAKLSKKAAVATAKAVQSMAAALSALVGGAALITALCILFLVAAIIASPFGILFSNEPSRDAVPLSVAVSQVNMDLTDELADLQAGDYDSIDLQGAGPDWREVVAVFACKTAGGVDGVDVAELTPDRVERLKAVFWDMCDISSEVETIEHDGEDEAWTEKILHITITAKTAEGMRTAYRFDADQNSALTELLEELDTLDDLLADLSVSQEAVTALLHSLPDDLSPERRAVVETACKLVGKVNYFLGGYSRVFGWDPRWGTLQKVWAEGSPSTGTYRPYGLDCCGFVDWVFYNASHGEYAVGYGEGVQAQHGYCAPVSWDEAQPGDLVFYPEDSHVGIVGGWDESGNVQIIHCASGHNNVVITGKAGFATVGKPGDYGE